MPNQMMIAEIQPQDLAALGLAIGLMNEQYPDASQALVQLLGRIVTMETDDEQTAVTGAEGSQTEDTLGSDARPEELDEEAERMPDPMFMPPPPTAPFNAQDDFGAGPPPAGGLR